MPVNSPLNLAILIADVLVMRRSRLLSTDHDKQATHTNNNGQDICESLFHAKQTPPINIDTKPPKDRNVIRSLKNVQARIEVNTISRLSAKETEEALTMLIAVISKTDGNQEPNNETTIKSGNSCLSKGAELSLLLKKVCSIKIMVRPEPDPSRNRLDNIIGCMSLRNNLETGIPNANRKAAPSA
jgi:hypothetical protein